MTNLGDPNKKDQIIANLLNQGKTFREIASTADCSFSRITRVKKQVDQYGYAVGSLMH